MSNPARRGSLERPVLRIHIELAIDFDDIFDSEPPGRVLVGDLEALATTPADYKFRGIGFQLAVLVAADAHFTDGEGNRHTPGGCVA